MNNNIKHVPNEIHEELTRIRRADMPEDEKQRLITALLERIHLTTNTNGSTIVP